MVIHSISICTYLQRMSVVYIISQLLYHFQFKKYIILTSVLALIMNHKWLSTSVSVFLISLLLPQPQTATLNYVTPTDECPGDKTPCHMHS